MKTVVFWTKEAGTALGHAKAVDASSAEENRDKVENMLTSCPPGSNWVGRLVSLQQELLFIFSRPARDLLSTPHFLPDQPRDILHGLI